jgi:hypothetical protein
VVTATVAVPDAPVSRSYAWDVAWADAVREASQLGAEPATAEALERGAGAVSGGEAQVVVAANGEAVLTWRLPPGTGVSSVRVGPLPAPAGGGGRRSAAAGAAIGAVGDLMASLAERPSPAAVRGIKAVAERLAEQQVAVLLVAADVARDATAGSSYRISSRPTEFLADNSGTGVEVPLDDGLVWAALHQDAIVVQLPDRTGPLAGEPAAALLRRGSAG